MEAKNLLDAIPKEELEKLLKIKESKIKVEQEDLLLAEFAERFGWQAYLAAKNDEIDVKEFMMLIAGGRKRDMQRLYQLSQASFIGAGSSRAKRPGQTFRKLTRKILRLSEADK